MKHIWSKLCVGTLAAAMTFGISACSLGGVSTADATVYVRGLINLTFLGQFDEDYLKLVDSDETESQEIYDSNLDVDVDNFASYYAHPDPSALSGYVRQGQIRGEGGGEAGLHHLLRGGRH